MTGAQEIIEKLNRNAKFYEAEAAALAEVSERRDRRRLGAEEAATMAALLREAAIALAAE